MIPGSVVQCRIENAFVFLLEFGSHDGGNKSVLIAY